MSPKIYIFLVIVGIGLCHGAPAAKNDEPETNIRPILQVVRNNIADMLKLTGEMKKLFISGKVQLAQTTLATALSVTSNTVRNLSKLLRRPVNNLANYHPTLIASTTTPSSTISTAAVSMEKLNTIQMQLKALMHSLEKDKPENKPLTPAPTTLAPAPTETPKDKPEDKPEDKPLTPAPLASTETPKDKPEDKPLTPAPLASTETPKDKPEDKPEDKPLTPPWPTRIYHQHTVFCGRFPYGKHTV